MAIPLFQSNIILFLLFLLLRPIHSYCSISPSAPSIRLPRQSTSLSVADFGATGDGVHYDTAAIQSAIDSCPTPAPCFVTFPPGTYLTATICLRSGVVLDIQNGATVLAGTKIEDYPKDSSRWYAVLAENTSDVGITGGGVVDGQGLKFVEKFDKRKNVMVSWNKTGACHGDECRPDLVGFIGSKNVRVSNVTLRLPAHWCLHLVRCENTTIHDVSIYGDFDSPNNDGIDIEDSNNTYITRCKIDTGDDAICPKSSSGPVINVTATNCWIRTKSSAVKLGSASWFNFSRMVFDNITIVESHRGLGFQLRDGGSANDITFSNINISTRYYDPSWWGRAEPIYITTCPRDSRSKVGSISNIRFINITAISENGVFLSGSKAGALSNLRFANVSLTFKRWTEYDGGLADYRPDCQGLVKHGVAGMIMEHIEGLEFENVEMRWSEDRSLRWNNPLDFRPSTVNNISFFNFHSGYFKE